LSLEFERLRSLPTFFSFLGALPPPGGEQGRGVSRRARAASVSVGAFGGFVGDSLVTGSIHCADSQLFFLVHGYTKVLYECQV